MAAEQASENHGDEWSLIWYLQWGIYTSIPTWTNSQDSLAAAEAPGLKISSHWRYPNQHENSPKLRSDIGDLILGLTERELKLRKQHDQNFLMEGEPL